MAEPVDIDSIPVRLTTAQQKKWDSGAQGKREVRKQIRNERLDRQLTPEEMGMPAPDFKTVVGDG